MKIRTLQQQHDDYDGALWLDYYALYKGGKEFRNRVKRFLRRNPQEMPSTHNERCAEAVYRSYIGTIVDYFASLLFSVPLIYKAKIGDREIDTPEWSQLFVDDIDGRGTDLPDFLRQGMVDACVRGKAFWLLDFPESYGSGQDKSEAEKIGALDVKVKHIPRERVLDWSYDARGKLRWAIIRDEQSVRDEPEDTRGSKTITWQIVDRQRIRTFEVTIPLNHALPLDEEAQMVSEVNHGLGVVPMVDLHFGDGMWVANRLESPQLEHFRLTAANNWSMRRSCYAMPVFNLTDPAENAGPTMGAGYYLKIGLEEKVSYLAPPYGHYESMTTEVKNQKDELFRLVTQMSLGVDNNAAAVGRSGESKLADAEMIQVTLRSYANKVRDAVKSMFKMVSVARGDDVEWHVEGLDKFETLPPDALIELLKVALDIGVPSNTFKLEAKYRAAGALLPGLDSSTMDTIRDEIEDGIAQEESTEHDLLTIAAGVRAGAAGRPEADRRGGSAATVAGQKAIEGGEGQRADR